MRNALKAYYNKSKYSKEKILLFKLLLVVILFLGVTQRIYPQSKSTKSIILNRVMTYKDREKIPDDTIKTNVYLRYYFNRVKKNATLNIIPTMYAISRGGKEFAGESYNDVLINDGEMIKSTRRLNISTIPHFKNTMPTLVKYLTPDVYDKTLLDNQLLSPFNSHNQKLYKYKIIEIDDTHAEITFHPKRRNTQLVSGSATVNSETGQILRVKLNGEYDMINFHIDALMGKQGPRSLYPETCDINSTFRFLGNKITCSYHSVFDNLVTLPDTLVDSHDVALMDELRPTPLPDNIEEIYVRADSIAKEKALRDSPKKERWHRILWDLIGDNLVNRIKGNFGTDNQGSFRLSPIINPLYLGYSNSKGITYKFKLNASYAFTPSQEISLNFRAGYSFKQHQFNFTTPITYTFNRKHNGYVQYEIGNGNRITYANIVNHIKNDHPDVQNLDSVNMKYFKDFHMKLVANYDITPKWGGQVGLVFHKRSAVDRGAFHEAGLQARYYSFAPMLELKYRPYGYKGPIFTVDYERGIHAGLADMEYERFEFDASWLRKFNRLRSLSMRLGGGFYTSQNKSSYFVDYTNFRDETIPVGWNDDWSGEFQLLRSEWYNSSKYYIRGNVTFESPLMALSLIPYVGRLMELERVYMNFIFVDHLHPYIEYGYGFTNRFFSFGVFLATKNLAYDRIGCRFAIELFNDW